MMPYYRYYNPYNRNPYFYNNYRPAYRTNFTPSPVVEPPPAHNKYCSKTDKRSNFLTQNDENVWFDLFGIKLYFDDVLILSLLFFLYKEEVKDEGLFLALVLLLIS